MIDPTHHEECVMTGRMTATLNSNGDVCAIQKPGGESVSHSVIMHCLKLAHVKATDITTKIRDAVSSLFLPAIAAPVYLSCQICS